MSVRYQYSGLTPELYQLYGRWYISPPFILVINADINNKKRPRLMPRTVQMLIILLYHKGM